MDFPLAVSQGFRRRNLIMKKTVLAATMLSFGLAAGTVSLPARADSHDILNFDAIMKMADKNKDGMVTKAEFMDAMGKAYDMKMGKMKAMKDTKMMKGDAMTRDGMKALIEDVYRGA
jgi:hypothetical protein